MDSSIAFFQEKRRALEEYLKESMSRYKTFFSSNPDAILALDLNGYFVRLNPACKQITGYSDDEIAKLTYLILVHVEDLDKVFHHFHKAVEGQVQNYDCKIIHSNGHYIVVNITNAPISVNDEIVGVYAVVKDITDLKRKTEEHRKIAEIHDLLINNSMDVIARTDLEGRYLYISPACFHILGFTQEELIGTSCFDLLHKEDLKKAIDNNKLTLKGKEIRLDTYRMCKKDGSYVWMESLCKSIINTQTQGVKEIVSVARDITQRKLAEEDIKKREERYSNLVEHSSDAVIIAKDGKILFINHTGVELFGALNKNQLIGKHFFDFLHPEYFEIVKNRIKQVSEGNAVPFMEQKFHSIDGRDFEAEVKGIPTIYDNKPAVHLIIRDINERKQTHKLLLDSEKLTVAGQLAAGIAHEVRNPLTAIKGFFHLMEDSLKEKKSYFDIIGSEISRIELILSELLTLAKPQDLKFEKINLIQLIEQVKTLIDTQAIMNNIEILTIFESDIFEITCDENQLKQVFINLLKNSIEAMSDGGTITVEVKKHSVDKIKLIFIDTGEGIPQHILKRIGEPFFTTKDNGTGLGLMISKQIVENHYGSIHFWSDTKGTVIEIILPT